MDEEENNFRFCYEDDLFIKDKINVIVIKIYGVDGVDYIFEVDKEIVNLEKFGFIKVLVCMVKI